MQQKLRGMKTAEQLADIDKESEDVLVRMMDDRSGESIKNLHGHSGPVYATSFSPDRTLLLSCSEDASSQSAAPCFLTSFVYRVLPRFTEMLPGFSWFQPVLLSLT